MDENEIDVGANEPIGEGTYNTSTQLSDVIEVIKETDPDFTESNNNQILHPRNQKLSQMFNGGGELPAAAAQPRPNVRRPQAYVKIIEQPAPKALRFRYECEGRSAGSLPGENSTPENKTYPEIQLVGFQGRAVVVVSCVTKDAPYKTHPHNLVGREGCKLGVCTMEIPTETMRVQFPNLGIQCVKKKQIERSLRQREQIKVDPFRQGYHHRDQPTSIDLNAVRLCFQVFLEGAKTNKFTVALPPVVSNVIYDKKAMSDLTIVKLSDCVSYVDGGRKDILLACEKVAKEDIQIRFYEEKDSQVVWEGYADFQPSQVFKQHVIWFRTPRYRTLEVTEPVKVFIQLRRPSDGQTSEPLPFELLPMDSGRPPYWTYKRNLSKKANYQLFSKISADKTKRQSQELFEPVESNNNVEVKKCKIDDDVMVVEEKSFNELIDQVAELDEIYSITHKKLVEEDKDVVENLPETRKESFDDAKTYSSLQLAFKNPVNINMYDIVEKPPINDSSLPPLPPKRTKKMETYIGEPATNQNLTQSNSGSTRSVFVNRSHSFTIQRPKSQGDLAPSEKSLPPLPNMSSTLPNPKKRGFFSKLFRRKSKTPSASREASVTPSVNSVKTLQIDQTLGKSSGNISTHSSNSIRIPLRDSPPFNFNPTAPNFEDFDMTLDLTEAENYALYTTVAPHATQSEFDEFSCYYAPVEGGKLLTNAEFQAKST